MIKKMISEMKISSEGRVKRRVGRVLIEITLLKIAFTFIATIFEDLATL